MGRVGSRPGGGASRATHVSHSSHSMAKPSMRSGSSHNMNTGRTSTPKPTVMASSVRLGKTGGFGDSGRIGTSPKPETKERETVRRTEPARREESVMREVPSVRPVVHVHAAPPPPPVYRPRPTVVHETVVINNGSGSSGSLPGEPARAYAEPAQERSVRHDIDDRSFRQNTVANSYSHSEVPDRGRSLKSIRNGMVAFIICAVLCALLAIAVSKAGIGSNTTNREKLDLGYGWTNDTCYDELGWIADEGRLNRNLKAFYEATGATPYVALVHEPEVSGMGPDAEFEFADQWYSENLPNEGYVLCMYFDSLNEYEDGNCQLVVGSQADILMDAEAQEVFWNYLDYYWGMDPDEISEDELFSRAFVKTGERIMQRRTETGDVLKWLFIVLGIGFMAGVVVAFVVLRREQEAQRAAETERILSQPLHGLDGHGDPLLEKYNK